MGKQKSRLLVYSPAFRVPQTSEEEDEMQPNDKDSPASQESPKSGSSNEKKEWSTDSCARGNCAGRGKGAGGGNGRRDGSGGGKGRGGGGKGGRLKRQQEQ